MEYHYAAQYMSFFVFFKAYIMLQDMFVTFINYRFNSVIQLSWTLKLFGIFNPGMFKTWTLSWVNCIVGYSMPFFIVHILVNKINWLYTFVIMKVLC